MKTAIQPDQEITLAYMDWARRLIAQVQFERNCEDTLEALTGISGLLTRTEQMIMEIKGGPSPELLQAHRECLESMQTAARGLVARIEAGTDDGELLTRARTFGAFLEDNWQRWHAEVSPDAVEALQKKIFHGAA